MCLLQCFSAGPILYILFKVFVESVQLPVTVGKEISCLEKGHCYHHHPRILEIGYTQNVCCMPQIWTPQHTMGACEPGPVGRMVAGSLAAALWLWWIRFGVVVCAKIRTVSYRKMIDLIVYFANLGDWRDRDVLIFAQIGSWNHDILIPWTTESISIHRTFCREGRTCLPGTG